MLCFPPAQRYNAYEWFLPSTYRRSTVHYILQLHYRYPHSRSLIMTSTRLTDSRMREAFGLLENMTFNPSEWVRMDCTLLIHTDHQLSSSVVMSNEPPHSRDGKDCWRKKATTRRGTCPKCVTALQERFNLCVKSSGLNHKAWDKWEKDTADPDSKKSCDTQRDCLAILSKESQSIVETVALTHDSDASPCDSYYEPLTKKYLQSLGINEPEYWP